MSKRKAEPMGDAASISATIALGPSFAFVPVW